LCNNASGDIGWSASRKRDNNLDRSFGESLRATWCGEWERRQHAHQCQQRSRYGRSSGTSRAGVLHIVSSQVSV